MSEKNKAIVTRWFTEFWGNPWNPAVIDELAAPDIRFEYSMHAPRRGREDVKKFATEFRAAFPDLNFWGTADLIAEDDYVVGQLGKAVARTPGKPSAICPSVPCRTVRARRCASPGPPCCV